MLIMSQRSYMFCSQLLMFFPLHVSFSNFWNPTIDFLSSNWSSSLKAFHSDFYFFEHYSQIWFFFRIPKISFSYSELFPLYQWAFYHFILIFFEFTDYSIIIHFDFDVGFLLVCVCVLSIKDKPRASWILGKRGKRTLTGPCSSL